MVEIIGVRFSNAGKIYYFSPKGQKIDAGINILVETARGMEMGRVVIANKEVDDSEIVSPLRDIVRIATEEDFRQVDENKQMEKEAFKIAVEKIREFKIAMKLVDVEYTFDRSKILFYFTADGRVDFRELVKALAGIFHTRIELRQIGVRDEARLLGSYGICGRYLCCGSFLDDFRPVSIKMSKEQGLSLNPAKISGTCGRLMCCLQYEQNAYDDMLKKLPRRGETVETADGVGVVADVETLKGQIKVKFESGDSFKMETYKLGDFKVRGGRKEKVEDDEDISIEAEGLDEVIKEDIIAEEAVAENVHEQKPHKKNYKKRKHNKNNNHNRNKNKNNENRNNNKINSSGDDPDAE